MTSALPSLRPNIPKMPSSISSPRAKILYRFCHSDQAKCQADRAHQENTAEDPKQSKKRRRRDIFNRTWHGLRSPKKIINPSKRKSRSLASRRKRSQPNAEGPDSKIKPRWPLVTAQDDKIDKFKPARMQQKAEQKQKINNADGRQIHKRGAVPNSEHIKSVRIIRCE